MKLVINTIPLLTPLTGIGKYTYEISKRVKDDFDTTFYYGFYSKNLIQKEIKFAKNSFLKKLAKKILLKTSKFYNKTFDVYFEPNFIVNENIKAKKRVVTVHDFSFMNEKWHPKERVEYFQKNFWKNIHLADEIIVVSEFIKREALKYLDFKEENIHVIYNGIDHNVFKIYSGEELFAVKRKFALPDDFILFVGSIEPRKNLVSLLKAYNALPGYLKKRYNLVLVGFKGWNNNEIMDLIDKNKEFIKYLGYLSDIDLAKIYNLSSLFVYPSLYEGFGIPILEAIACGSCVLTSNVSSMPEVGGDSVVYVDPFNEKDLYEKLLYALKNDSFREKYIQKGLKRAKLFSWEKSARDHKKLLSTIV